MTPLTPSSSTVEVHPFGTVPDIPDTQIVTARSIGSLGIPPSVDLPIVCAAHWHTPTQAIEPVKGRADERDATSGR